MRRHCLDRLGGHRRVGSRGRARRASADRGRGRVGGSTAVARPIRSDDGVASIQSAVLYPLVLVLIMVIVQGVVYFHAQNVALSVANAAVHTVRVEGGTVEAGYADAERRLSHAGILAGSEVHIARSSDAVDVTVRGLAPSLLPGVRGLPVERTATGPVEHFTPVVVG